MAGKPDDEFAGFFGGLGAIAAVILAFGGPEDVENPFGVFIGALVFGYLVGFGVGKLVEGVLKLIFALIAGLIVLLRLLQLFGFIEGLFR